MRYLVTTNCTSPCLTNWFNPENHWNIEMGLVVYDLLERKYMTNGKDWIDIEIDNL